MRHGKSGRRLGRNSSHRKAMFRNMAASMIKRQINDAQDAMGFRLAISTGHSSYLMSDMSGVNFDADRPFGSRKRMPGVDVARGAAAQREE